MGRPGEGAREKITTVVKPQRRERLDRGHGLPGLLFRVVLFVASLGVVITAVIAGRANRGDLLVPVRGISVRELEDNYHEDLLEQAVTPAGKSPTSISLSSSRREI